MLARRPSTTDSITAGTTQSPLTRNTAMNTHTSDHYRKFEEIEAAFLKHHDEIERTTGRMDTLEDRITRTMSACEKLSSQVATMDSRFTTMFEKLETLLITRISVVSTTPTNPQELRARPQEQNRDTGNTTGTQWSIDCDASTGLDSATHRSYTTTTSSIQIRSPEKKKPRSTPDKYGNDDMTDTDNELIAVTQNETDQTGVQYTISRPSDEGTHE